MSDKQHLHKQTIAIHSGVERSQYGETSPAIYLNSGFCYDSAQTAQARFDGSEPGFVYSRYSNPNLAMLEERLVAIEEGAEAAHVVASGMAAVFAAIMCQIKPGDVMIAGDVLFGSCHYIVSEILPRIGIEVLRVKGTDAQAWRDAATSAQTGAGGRIYFFCETPANPTLDVVDLRALGQLSQEVGGFLIVDNIFASPFGQSPFTYGADVVVYSTTKHMDGHGRTLGGAVLGSAEFISDILLPFCRHTGPALSPFNAWMVYKELESFPLRMQRHCENALYIAEELEKSGKFEEVLYPLLPSFAGYEVASKQMKFGGSVLSLRCKGGKDAAFALMNRLRIIVISNNLGDARSMITHPASSTHSNIDAQIRQQYGIGDNLVRISIGLEHAPDLLEDILQAVYEKELGLS